MKIVKWGLGAVLAVVGLALIVGLLMKKEYSVERQVTINRSQAEVFAFVQYLKNQEKFSVWAQLDPAMERTFRGTDGSVGAVAGWSSENKNVGRGEQEITGMVAGERIDYELRFFEPFEAQDKAYLHLETPAPGQTLVKWGFHGSMKYPMNLMLLFMNMEEMLGSDLQTGLENLKKILEK